MLTSGRLLAATTVHALELQTASVSCVGLPVPWKRLVVASGYEHTPSPVEARASRAQGQHSRTNYGPWGARWLSQRSTGDKDSSNPAPEGPPSNSSATGSSPTQAAISPRAAPPLASPPTSPEARSLADTLRQSSPTGRLLDLFAPTATISNRQSLEPTSASATTPATAPAAINETDVVRVVMRAVENCKPLMKIQQNKAGNKVLMVPKPLDPSQSTNFAVKWIVQAALKRRDAARGRVPMSECLALELLLAYQRKGSSRSRRDEVHKVALDNRANVRTKWW